jgi:hypothetical protein
MNNSPRNSLDYSNSQLEQFSDDALLEVLPEKTDEDNSTKYVLIKHDYYSTDSEHGREILSGFLTSLINSSYNSLVIYLIDKGVKLLDESDPLNNKMNRLIEKSESVIASEDSIILYNVNLSNASKIVQESLTSITSDIVYLDHLLILE